jgi:hypothetical protein
MRATTPDDAYQLIDNAINSLSIVGIAQEAK